MTSAPRQRTAPAGAPPKPAASGSGVVASEQVIARTGTVVTGDRPTTHEERAVDAQSGQRIRDEVTPDRPAGRWRRWLSRNRIERAVAPERARPDPTTDLELDVAPNDPLLAYCQQAGGVVDVDTLELDSPALRQLKAAGTKLVVPLVTQGELIGLLSLGPRLSERDYSGDDRRLLDMLAGHAAPAVRVGQLVREQEKELVARERIEQELHVAQLIQQQFLPKRVPDLPSWHIAAFYRPARTVGGDFYDFIDLPDGRVFIVVGDVTDKGVPAALVMASTHSILRASATRLESPGEVLKRANDVLYEDIPAHMFVTCLAVVLEPKSGKLTYANAGHDLPYVRTHDGVQELRATGMPLGLMAGMSYEEKTAFLAPGDSLLLHSDGIAEAHAPNREMFGFPRLMHLVGTNVGGEALIDAVLAAHARFIGPHADQEDDITMVTLERSLSAAGPIGTDGDSIPGEQGGQAGSSAGVLTEFDLESEAGNERIALNQVAEVVDGLGLSDLRLEALKTAVAETTMNAIEHGNKNRREVPVHVRVTADADEVRVAITDQGGLVEEDAPTPATPDLDAKLAGLQSPRGWGLFLIANMVDEMTVSTDGCDHTVLLIMKLAEDSGQDLAGKPEQSAVQEDGDAEQL
jgi:serine phosphatase RsbU (regulator of sigma subunit)/anti-sigma regulatory factor (Ser/Thr protein kinase)